MAFALRDASNASLAEGAALVRAIDGAKQSSDQGELSAAWGQLRPFVHSYVPYALAGPFWELCARCAFAGVATSPSIDGQQALTRALHAYQEEHDVPGMARTHAALGSAWMGRGELSDASRELGYAQQLCTRSGIVAERVGSLCRRAEIALMQMQAEAADEWVARAFDVCRSARVDPVVEVQARLMAAQSASMVGRTHETARHLLWAERLSVAASSMAVEDAGLTGALGASLGTSQALHLMRAEALYRLGYPRRALACVRQTSVPLNIDGILDGQSGPLEGRAHQLRLWGAALTQDDPRQALTLLEAAERSFVRLRQPYFRAFCQIARAQAGRRANSPLAPSLWETAEGLRLSKWPLLARHLEDAKGARASTSLRVRGRVELPWVVKVGQGYKSKAKDREDGNSAREDKGFLGPLYQAVGRKRPRADS